MRRDNEDLEPMKTYRLFPITILAVVCAVIALGCAIVAGILAWWFSRP